MSLDKHKLSLKGEPDHPLGQDYIASVDAVAPQDNALSREFFDLIYDLDPGAANDNYYVTSADFVELHTKIRKYLIRRMIWWVASVCLGMTGLALIYA